MPEDNPQGVASEDEQNKATIVSLLEERRGYEINGDKAGVAAVNQALKALGYTAEKPSKRAESRPASRKASKR